MNTPCPTGEMVDNFFSGLLTEEEEERIADHLLNCKECERYKREAAARTAALKDSLCQALQPTLQVPGCTLLRKVSEGGGGELWEAIDDAFNRTVAVKVMKAGQAFRSLAGRFRLEAETCGRLQHPSIVPVYRLGVLKEDGRPYYVMKFVQGDTVDEWVRKRAPGLSERLRVFREVCRALANAHAHGVIHRDVKPANVMVSDFDEALVLDFGLVKVRGAPDHVGVERNGSPTEPDVTQDGSLLGTPNCMAPEQARRRPSEVDERTDVFGLGALLFWLLTGQPLYQGGGRNEILARAAEADVRDAVAALKSRHVDPELIGLVKRCLAKKKEDRPADARAVEEAVKAYQDRVQAEADAEQRRRESRPLKLGLAGAALVVLALVGLGGVWALLGWESRRRDAEAALGKGEQALLQRRLGEAHSELEHARRVGDVGLPGLRKRQQELQSNLELVTKLEEAWGRRLVREARTQEGELAWVLKGFAEAFDSAGLDVEGDAEDLARRVAASAVRQQLLDAIDTWALLCDYLASDPKHRKQRQQHLALRDRLTTLAQRADDRPGQVRARIRDPKLWSDRVQLKVLAEEALKTELSPGLVVLLTELLMEHGESPLQLLEAALDRYPGDVWFNMLLGFWLQDTDPARAWAHFHAAAELRPNNLAALNNIGNLLDRRGDTERAIQHYRKILRVEPRHLLALANLGGKLSRSPKKEDLDEAVKHCELALEIQPGYVTALINLGGALNERNRGDDRKRAIQLLREAVQTQPDEVAGLNNLGLALFERNEGDDREQAIQLYRKALRNAPGYVTTLLNLARALGLSTQSRDRNEAIHLYRRALAIQPDNVKGLVNLAADLGDRGWKGDRDEAIGLCRHVLGLKPELVPADLRARALNNLGLTLFERNRGRDREVALRLYGEAIELNPDLPNVYRNLGWAHIHRGMFEDALTAFQKESELLPNRPQGWIDRTRKLIRLDAQLGQLPQEPEDAGELLGLGQVCYFRKRYAEAVRFYSVAFKKDPGLAADPRSDDRYAAACAAALVAAGLGGPAGPSPPEEQARLRKHALTWLRQDLVAWSQLAQTEAGVRPVAIRVLSGWLENPALATVRDPKELVETSPSELKGWVELWRAAGELHQSLLSLEAGE
jgi:tetratricopeptide (TPR) repeat protein